MSLTQPLKLSFLAQYFLSESYRAGTCGPIDMIKVINSDDWALLSVKAPKQGGFGILSGTQLQNEVF